MMGEQRLGVRLPFFFPFYLSTLCACAVHRFLHRCWRTTPGAATHPPTHLLQGRLRAAPAMCGGHAARHGALLLAAPAHAAPAGAAAGRLAS